MRLALGLTVGLLCLGLIGCDEDDDYLDHEPPEGQGSLIVVNESWDDLSLYLDGELTTKVTERSDRTLDMAPGVYRVVLMERRYGDRSYRDDVDILADKLTVLQVSETGVDTSGEYSVTLTFE